MHKTFTIQEIISILNSVQLQDIESGKYLQIGHCVVPSNDGEMLYANEVAKAFGVDFEYIKGKLCFAEKNNQ